MAEDSRCCGSGACIINPQGYCWCGQKWDGTRMSLPALDPQTGAEVDARNDPQSD